MPSTDPFSPDDIARLDQKFDELQERFREVERRASAKIESLTHLIRLADDRLDQLNGRLHSPSASDKPAGYSTRRVLIVDDDKDGAEVLQALLNMHGHEVRTAADGFVAMASLMDWLPDVIMLDIDLPGRSGYEVATLIRDIQGGRSIKIVGWTGAFIESKLWRSAGFDACLQKPCDFDVIHNYVM